jgi:signal transduction histidine kinase
MAERPTRLTAPPRDTPTSSASPIDASLAQAFPVVLALDALDGWFRDPSPEGRERIEAALVAIVRVARADGARLVVDAPPLPAISIGEGTLSGTDLPAHAVRYDLVAPERGAPVGALWLDGPDPSAAIVVRALEIALAAGWSRAEVRGAVERLAALDEATRAIAGVLDLDRVLQLIADRVRILAGARYAAIGTFDDRGAIGHFLTSGMSSAERDRIGAPPRGRGLLGAILREGRSIRLDDLTTDPRSVGFPDQHPPMRSFLGVPIVVKGRSVGNLYLTDKQGATGFSAADQELVEVFAIHAGIAIENARLHDQVQRLAIVEERERIGRDLHDGIIQSLYAVGLSLEDLPDLMDESPDEAAIRVDRAIESLNLTIRDIRNFIFGLRPELLEQADLEAALTALAGEFRLNTMVDIDVVLGPDVPADLSVDERHQVLQMARECLSNVARHSKATRATLSLGTDADGVVLRVSDNGRGFDPAAIRGPSHQGLANIRGRARALGGEVTVESRPGDGTRIIVRLPPRDQARHDSPEAIDQP